MPWSAARKGSGSRSPQAPACRRVRPAIRDVADPVQLLPRRGHHASPRSTGALRLVFPSICLPGPSRGDPTRSNRFAARGCPLLGSMRSLPRPERPGGRAAGGPVLQPGSSPGRPGDLPSGLACTMVRAGDQWRPAAIHAALRRRSGRRRTLGGDLLRSRLGHPGFQPGAGQSNLCPAVRLLPRTRRQRGRGRRQKPPRSSGRSNQSLHSGRGDRPRLVQSDLPRIACGHAPRLFRLDGGSALELGCLCPQPGGGGLGPDGSRLGPRPSPRLLRFRRGEGRGPGDRRHDPAASRRPSGRGAEL